MLYCKIDHEQNDIQYYEMILASDGEMYTPYDSTYLFSCVGWQIDRFKFDLSLLNTKYTTNMSHMFNSFGSERMITLNLVISLYLIIMLI